MGISATASVAGNGGDETRANKYAVLSPGVTYQIENEIKRSRFIGYALRVEDESGARDFLAELRKTHHKARHICHAFVLGADREIQRSSDDGEPAGTAGIPILEAIVNRQITAGVADQPRTDLADLVVAVVRYFGGIKLGAGGLVQAYSGAASAVLDSATMLARTRLRLCEIQADLIEAGRLETSLRALGYQVQPTQYLADSAVVTIALPDDDTQIAQAAKQLQSLTAGKADLVKDGSIWLDLPMVG